MGLLLLLTAGGLLGLLGDPTHGVLRTLGSLARLLRLWPAVSCWDEEEEEAQVLSRLI